MRFSSPNSRFLPAAHALLGREPGQFQVDTSYQAHATTVQRDTVSLAEHDDNPAFRRKR
jgi:hypothetical protein